MSTAIKTPTMHWPTAVDFQTALQVPAICFKDPELKSASIATGPLGLPFAVTGNVAAVFRLKLPGGDVAMRCFTRSGAVEKLEHRYLVLNDHLKQHPIEALVRCIYRKDEMLVGGKHYPIVLMEWIKGVQLPSYIEAHLNNSEALRTLADRWRVLMAEIQSSDFAHGDLSDGNILVDPEGRFHLIDYDAAYIPGLNKTPPNEVGKPNYQHPDRLNPASSKYGYYAPNVDAFASLVIYLTLRAIASDAELWELYHTGDNLIFVQRDFEQPGETPIWPHLRSSKDLEVRQLVDVLEKFCSASVADLPSLEHVIEGTAPRLQVRRNGSAAGGSKKMNGYGKLPPLREGEQPLGPREAAYEDTAVSTHARTWEAPRQLRWGSWAAVVGTLLIVLLASGYWLLQSGIVGRKPVEVVTYESGAWPMPSEAVSSLPPQDLAGRYTGYVRHEDGTRELLALSIDPPAVFFAQNTARFSFVLNSKEYQTTGAGSYDMNTGHLQLGEEYQLYIASADGDEIVLASMDREQENPNVWFKRRVRP